MEGFKIELDRGNISTSHPLAPPPPSWWVWRRCGKRGVSPCGWLKEISLSCQRAPRYALYCLDGASKIPRNPRKQRNRRRFPIGLRCSLEKCAVASWPRQNNELLDAPATQPDICLGRPRPRVMWLPGPAGPAPARQPGQSEFKYQCGLAGNPSTTAVCPVLC